MSFRSRTQELKWVLLNLDNWFLMGNDLVAVADGIKPATDIVRISPEKYLSVRHSLDRILRHSWDIAEKEQDAEAVLIEQRGLETVSYGKKDSDDFFEGFAVGLPSSKATDIIAPHLAYFSDLPFSDRFNEFMKEIEGLSVAKVVVKLCDLGDKAGIRWHAEEDPALEIILGILYGFENCCIRHYAEQGYFCHNIKYSPQRQDKNFYGYRRCPSCRASNKRPVWYKDDKSYRRYWWQLYLGRV